MTAYFIVIRESEVRDEAALGEYFTRVQANAPAAAAEFGIQPLIVYGNIETLEGAAPSGLLVMGFPSKEKATAWYNSPAYQDALPYRKAAADWRVAIVDGIA
ncbi:MAG TPA: DUF1330 domain-containing protein [Sphingobium sp.]|uniref:DUF1330 domain-containing protein n=1 Tax=Sphingobium sp. TaxID=1912891 RepID=UPI002ED56875